MDALLLPLLLPSASLLDCTIAKIHYLFGEENDTQRGNTLVSHSLPSTFSAENDLPRSKVKVFRIQGRLLHVGEAWKYVTGNHGGFWVAGQSICNSLTHELRLEDC